MKRIKDLFKSLVVSGMITVLIGLQWGDEGKGKVTDALSELFDIVCRFQGGPNAGHTIYFKKKKEVLHQMPSSVLNPDVISLMGKGMVADMIFLLQKAKQIQKDHNINVWENLKIQSGLTLILPTHRYLDGANEAAKGKDKIGSTLKGVGPAYVDKTGRRDITFGDIFKEGFWDKFDALVERHMGLLSLLPEFHFPLEKQMKEFRQAITEIQNLELEYKLTVSNRYVQEQLKKGKAILAEGAQGGMLNIHHGDSHNVTCSDTSASGVATGLGVDVKRIGEIIGISKIYLTKVGSGDFPTEFVDEVSEYIAREGKEFGATTGRPRRIGWPDLPLLKYAAELGVTKHFVMKVDILDGMKSFKVCTHYITKSGERMDIWDGSTPFSELTPQYKTYERWPEKTFGVTDPTKMGFCINLVKNIYNDVQGEVIGISNGPEPEHYVIAA